MLKLSSWLKFITVLYLAFNSHMNVIWWSQKHAIYSQCSEPLPLQIHNDLGRTAFPIFTLMLLWSWSVQMHSACHCVWPPLAFHSSVHTDIQRHCIYRFNFSCNVIRKLSKLLDNNYWIKSVFDCATGGEDYISINITGQFQPLSSNRQFCFPISILRDTIIEKNEIFSAHLTVNSPMERNLQVVNTTTVITILDSSKWWLWHCNWRFAEYGNYY